MPDHKDRAFTIAVTGSRDAEAISHHVKPITEALMEVAEGKGFPVVLIHGGARGVDRLAAIAGRTLGWHIVMHEADWKQYGKFAGHKRNREMLDIGRPDIVMAFPVQGAENKGTSNMVGQAKDRGIPVITTMLPSLKEMGGSGRE